MPYAAVLTGYGSPETLVWSEVALPAPGPGQIRMRVHAAGVGPTDLKIRRGDLREVFPLPDPAVLGFEAAGTVDALGPSVRNEFNCMSVVPSVEHPGARRVVGCASSDA
ncbi:alcohol dehydrogenase catalytic domain-containing protein [Streptomyces mirabilis]|uniref:alcohol dehydrogenase catalytic domain-containing protein n=1 Tax=Streptomyces mirabilis TaxID=68239 RepID=UPI0036DF94BD